MLIIAAIAGGWGVNQARLTATDVFNRSLLSAALAVSRDVSLSGGDALSPKPAKSSPTYRGPGLLSCLRPNGVIVAGYATPPVGIPATATELSGASYFAATCLGRPVSGARLQTLTEIDGFSGIFTTTVRAAFVQNLVLRSLVTIASLILSVALGGLVRRPPPPAQRSRTGHRTTLKRRAFPNPPPDPHLGPQRGRHAQSPLHSDLSKHVRPGRFGLQCGPSNPQTHRRGVLSLAEAVHRAPPGPRPNAVRATFSSPPKKPRISRKNPSPSNGLKRSARNPSTKASTSPRISKIGHLRFRPQRPRASA